MAICTIYAITGHDHAGILAEQEIVEDADALSPVLDRYRKAHTLTLVYAIDVSPDTDCYPADLDHVTRTVTAVGGHGFHLAHRIITSRVDGRLMGGWRGTTEA